MARLKRFASRIWAKTSTATANSPNEATPLADLTEYNPDEHPNVIEWLEFSLSSTTNPGSKPVGMHEVPLQGHICQYEEQFRRSWNGLLPAVEALDGLIDIKFDRLRTVDILGPVEFRDRNDSGLSLVEDFTRPPAARKHPAEATGASESGILELSGQWETREGCLRDLIEEHAERCRKCWHECWA